MKAGHFKSFAPRQELISKKYEYELPGQPRPLLCAADFTVRWRVVFGAEIAETADNSLFFA
jgi:hypothetical protein